MKSKNQYLSIFLFYWRNSLFSKSLKEYQIFKFYGVFTLFLFTFMWGAVNVLLEIQSHVDMIYLTYALIGLIGIGYQLYNGFLPSWNAHKSLLNNNGYESIHDFYLKRGF